MNAALPLHPECLVDAQGREQAVPTPVAAYEQLIRDLADLAVAAEQRERRIISHEQLLRELKGSGALLP